MQSLLENHPNIEMQRASAFHQDGTILDFYSAPPIHLTPEHIETLSEVELENTMWWGRTIETEQRQKLTALILFLAGPVAFAHQSVIDNIIRLMMAKENATVPQDFEGSQKLVQNAIQNFGVFFWGKYNFGPTESEAKLQMAETKDNLETVRRVVAALSTIEPFQARGVVLLKIIDDILEKDLIWPIMIRKKLPKHLQKMAENEFPELIGETGHLRKVLHEMDQVTRSLQRAIPNFITVDQILNTLHLKGGFVKPLTTLAAVDVARFIRISPNLENKDFKVGESNRNVIAKIVEAVSMGQINLTKQWISLYVQLAAIFEEHITPTPFGNSSPIELVELYAIHQSISAVLTPPSEIKLDSDKKITEAGAVELENDPMKELNAMIGLENLKKKIGEITSVMKINQIRALHNKKQIVTSNNLIFVGNPGTGKTETARLIARIYHDLGYLKTGHLVEVSRKDLVGSFIGKTAQLTAEKFEQAIGGVLFIDEAYALNPGSDRDFGAEAISTLMKMMEDCRDNIVVIAAGYGEEMSRFLASNTGFASRFSQVLEFTSYSPDELWQIFEYMANKWEYTVEEGLKDAFMALVPEERKETFGNGRWVRNLFERMQINQAKRLADRITFSASQMSELRIEDLPEKEKKTVEHTNKIGFVKAVNNPPSGAIKIVSPEQNKNNPPKVGEPARTPKRTSVKTAPTKVVKKVETTPNTVEETPQPSTDN